MNDSTPPPEIGEPARESRVVEAGPCEYEPPRLTLAGSLRDVLGKTGGRNDFGYKTHKP
jgi:hypothetical protein